MVAKVGALVVVVVLIVAGGLWLAGDRAPGGPPGDGQGLSGKLIVFHAGSLSVPFREIAEAFEREHPGVRVLREAAGSRTCARKVSELSRPCDVLASADYTVIDALLIPEHAAWNIRFATNEMAIVYRRQSRRCGEINVGNWHEILLADDVAFGRSDPDSDPCGYRAVLAMKLAEKHYGVEGLARRLLAKDLRYMRPKEVDLLALLEVGELDYILLYRSVAQQHGLPYVALPDEINLGNPEFAALYATVSVEVTGRAPGTTILKRGAPMAYGVTIPRSALHPRAALAFVDFLLQKEKGMAIIEKNGQSSLVPSPTDTYAAVPPALRKYALLP